jgi:hypothetical protein
MGLVSGSDPPEIVAFSLLINVTNVNVLPARQRAAVGNIVVALERDLVGPPWW